jgi:hypothetical protein
MLRFCDQEKARLFHGSNDEPNATRQPWSRETLSMQAVKLVQVSSPLDLSIVTCAAGTRTKYAQLLKRLFLWAKRRGSIRESPISDESTIKGQKGTERRRRIYPDEEGQLLANAGPRLQSLIYCRSRIACAFGRIFRR